MTFFKKVRKAVAPIKTTSRALGIFSTALAALDEVRENQRKRIKGNNAERDRLSAAIVEATHKRYALDDDNANAILELDAAEKAEKAIRALIPA